MRAPVKESSDRSNARWKDTDAEKDMRLVDGNATVN